MIGTRTARSPNGPSSAFLIIAVAIAWLLLFPVDASTQSTETDDGETVELTRSQLLEHQRNLSNCQQQKDQFKGRTEECRDKVETLQVRVEDLATDKGALQQREHQLQKELTRWYRKPLIWVPLTVALTGTAYTVGHFVGSGN